ncbi:MAG: hypothetical protein R3C17_01265 [Planctomycetaceae bacterium]
MRRSIRIALSVVVAVSAVTISVRASPACEGGNEDSTKAELLSIVVQVTTPDDEPIEGASVRPYGLRTRAERGSHYGWNPKTHGLNADLLTDAEGKTEIQYPKYVTERLETGEISLQVDHEEFRSVRCLRHRIIRCDATHKSNCLPKRQRKSLFGCNPSARKQSG